MSGLSGRSAENCAQMGSITDTGRAGTGRSGNYGGVENLMIAGPVFARTPLNPHMLPAPYCRALLVGKGWQTDSIPVINRSNYDRAAFEYAAQQWATTSAPRFSVQHQSPTLCSDVTPMKNAVILCDAAPWTGPTTDGEIAGFTANYTETKKKKRGKKSKNCCHPGNCDLVLSASLD